MYRRPEQIRDLLRRIETEMQRLDLWTTQPPPIDAFASTQPFCHDRMAFTEWLQWVFIPRLNALMEHGGSLPLRSQIAPLAEMTFARMTDRDTGTLLTLIAEFDALSNETETG